MTSMLATRATRRASVRFVFDDSVISFRLRAAPTFGDLAHAMGHLAQKRDAPPLAIDVTFTAPSSVSLEGMGTQGRGGIDPTPVASRVSIGAMPRCTHADAAAAAALAISAELVDTLPRLTRYARLLCRNHADADDLLQDTVMRLLSAAASYRLGTNFSAWACRVMRNRFLTVHVRGHRRTVSIDDAVLDLVPDRPTQPDGLEHQDLVDQFMRLPEESRTVLMLAGDTAYGEIALTSGCAVNTVKSRVHRARRVLRGMMRDAYEPRRAEVSAAPSQRPLS